MHVLFVEKCENLDSKVMKSALGMALIFTHSQTKNIVEFTS